MSLYPPYGGPKRRPGLALARKNQAIFAERFNWPTGALQTCWDLENRFPPWQVSWLGENLIKGFERPAGFWATVQMEMHAAEVFRTDPVVLAEVMVTVQLEHDYGLQGCAWCLAHSKLRVKL